MKAKDLVRVLQLYAGDELVFMRDTVTDEVAPVCLNPLWQGNTITLFAGTEATKVEWLLYYLTHEGLSDHDVYVVNDAGDAFEVGGLAPYGLDYNGDRSGYCLVLEYGSEEGNV